MKGKKGLEQTLVALILLLAVAVLLFFFGYGFSRWAEKQGTVEGCRISVLAAAQLGEGTIAGTLSGAPIEFECPPSEVVISEEAATVDGFEKEFSDSEKYEENVKRTLANQLTQCWYKFGEGKVNAFHTDIAIGLPEYICFYCSHITFKKPLVEEITGMQEYLEKEKIPVGVVTQDSITYFEYMAENYDFLEYEGDTATNGNLQIDNEIYSEWEYVIVFEAIGKRVKIPGTEKGIDEHAYLLWLERAGQQGSKESCDYYYE